VPEIRQPNGSVIGKAHKKVDGAARMTGAEAFTDDIQLPGMLHAKILRSPHAHARIKRIDTSRALALDGVYGVLTGADMPISYGVIPWTPDEQALAEKTARYVGDGVAAVAARDEETANAALKLIEIDWEVLEALTDPEEAELYTTHKIHEKNKRGNQSKRVFLEFGEVDEALDGSHLVVEGDYYFHGTTHTPIEPHCAIGQVDTQGHLTVWSATQVPHYLHRELSKVLGVPTHSLRVIQPPIGGAFGGKSEPFDLEFVVAKFAMQLGRPVKCLYTREEVFYAHRGRHPFDMQYRTGFDAEGNILAVDANTRLDGGAYSSFGLVTTYYSGQLLASPYRFGTYRFHSKRFYTNKPACGPKRGHGSVQPRFALEVQLDKAARNLGIDPIELRRRNFTGEHTTTVNGFTIRTSGFLECLEKTEAASGWKERWGSLPRGRGLGIAASTYISGTNYCIYPSDLPQSAVQICLDRSGRARLFAGTSDLGQGCDTMLGVIAADELGIELEDIRVVTADSDLTPVDLGAYSSRITLMAGNACIQAASTLADRIKDVLAAHWECDVSDIEMAHRRAWVTDDPEKAMPVKEAWQLAEAKLGLLGSTGQYDTPKEGIHADYRGATIGASPAYSYTVHIAEVTVDEETGEVVVEKIWAAHDCGKAISPVNVAGQIEGSVYMGAAEAVMEHHHVMPTGLRGMDKRRLTGPGVHGLLANSSLLDYRIPTSMDVPDIEAIIVECPDPMGPYGAREAGEGPLHPAIPAIANAVFDAVGVRIDRLPITPEKVWAALNPPEEEPC
jgi:4-hydroxybenzoyl-CoA reductase subunit alpha